MPTPAFLDGAERATWTAIEAAGAIGLVAGWQALPAPVPDIPAGWTPLAIVLLGFLLAGGKSWAATKWPAGNGSASLGLPPSAEPVPADQALVLVKPGTAEVKGRHAHPGGWQVHLEPLTPTDPAEAGPSGSRSEAELAPAGRADSEAHAPSELGGDRPHRRAPSSEDEGGVLG